MVYQLSHAITYLLVRSLPLQVLVIYAKQPFVMMNKAADLHKQCCLHIDDAEI